MARETREEFLGSRADVCSYLNEISEKLRSFGLGVQADQLQEVIAALRARKLLPILQDLEHPQAMPTKETVRWLAEQLTVATELLAEFHEDAEITGSLKLIERSKKFLQELGAK